MGSAMIRPHRSIRRLIGASPRSRRSRRVVERGVSGSIPLADRPEGAAMLEVLQSGDVVVSPKLDGVFRSALDALQQTEALRARGVSLHLLDLGGDIAGNGVPTEKSIREDIGDGERIV